MHKLAEKKLQNNEIKYKNLSKKLQISLNEKEALLKEIYHRVKNNLQVILSLLHLQIETIQDQTAKQILLESATRIKSMALVHELLYQSSSLANIEMVKYSNHFSKYLYDTYNINIHHNKLILDIDDVSLDIEKAIPCGLIINELISNIFKHAFPAGNGIIKLSLKKFGNKLLLTISDNGIGMPPNFDLQNANSLGMKLVYNLTKQIGGTIKMESRHGTTFTLTIR
ncbi:MAG: hypothetical protein A3F42_06280 [Gammaproteobacteria bacterium RIFCSPHIGHO2_12_FULL_37_34]|nr:MAG: hypothetical protein A3F42_06280 [Gammaproteobacteria bacterium RIFCSPHIGHO2_12_FULL_37_34]